MNQPWTERLHQGAEHPLRVHLIGVAGSGMSGLASLLLGLGHRVSGSDRVATTETERLQRAGLDFHCPHTAAAVDGAELVICSSAIKPGNLAYDAALAAGLPTVHRAAALVAIMAGKRGVVIAGTHGKTTTSALAAHVLRAAGVDPSHYVGAEIPVLGTNAHWSDEGEYFVAEGDESDGSLTGFHPEFAVLLNVEEEHLDHYTDGIEGIRRVFGQFLDATTGSIIYCASDAEAAVLCASRGNAISYGWSPDCDFSAEVLEVRGGSTDFEVSLEGVPVGKITLGIPGEHNVLNALAVIALATRLGVAFEPIAAAMRTFRGARRRFDVLYRSAYHTVVDDYGHHPTEVRVTVATASALRPERLICVFQPHRFTRTQLLREQFGKAFRGVDVLFVTDIYPAGEEPIPGISGQTIIDEVRASGGDCEVFSAPDVATAHLAVGASLRRGDTVLTLGAGNIHTVGAALARDLEVLDKLRRELDDPETDCRLYEPLRRHTTMKIGGPAQYWVEPASVESFARALRFFKGLGVPVRVIGRGSNLLIRDGGIPGAVIRPGKGEFDELRVSGGAITAGVGARFKKLSNVAKANGIGGFEWMEGIPGNVGGGLRMNAGAMGAQTFDQVVSVQYLDAAGELHERAAGEFAARYRDVPELLENYAVSAVFAGSDAAPEDIEARIAGSMARRKASQPVAASAGCIFKNPEGVAAGQLVEELGFKGANVGAARVSEVHGNFIVNEGGATAADVISLIEKIQAVARGQRGIELHTEVQIIGTQHPEF